MAILEKIEETDSLLYASLLNNLGEVYREKQDYLRAEDFLSRALELSERIRGPESYYVATAVQNLGIVARERKDYATAEAYYQRALSHPGAARSVRSPGRGAAPEQPGHVYRATGDNDAIAPDAFPRAADLGGSVRPVPAGHAPRRSATSPARMRRSATSPNALAFQRRADAILETATGAQRRRRLGTAEAGVRQQRCRSAPIGRFRCISDRGARAILTPPHWRHSSCCSERGACWTR